MNISQIRDYIKYLVTISVMSILKLLWIFPIREDTIIFLSYDGKQYSDSPRYLSDEIKKKHKEKNIVWVINGDKKIAPIADIKFIKKDSIKYIFFMCTSGTIISNNSISSYIPIRNNQIFLNTWHGGSPTKTVGYREFNPSPYYKYYFKIQNDKTTAIISSSDFFTKEVIAESFGFKRPEVLKFGLPRNDILLAEHGDIRKKVFDYFGLNTFGRDAIVLYAPTFRGNSNKSHFLKQTDMLSVKTCISHLNKKFGKNFIFLFRAHHAMQIDGMSGSIDATDYPDMQELLCAADVLITDYSSCMHDFLLMKKPVFLYIPDYSIYMTSRGFYLDIPTMPFPYAQTIAEFESNILKFDAIKYSLKAEGYFNMLGNYENGNATELTIEWLTKMWRKQSNCKNRRYD